MRRLLVPIVAVLALAGGLFSPVHAEDLGYGQWDNGTVGTARYRQATFYTLGQKAAYAEITGTITTRWNLQELSARGSDYRYWKLHVDTVIDPDEQNPEYTRDNDGLWTQISVWPTGATELQKWTTGTHTFNPRNCSTFSAGIGGGAGPFSASYSVADWHVCTWSKLVSKQNDYDIWRQHYTVKDFDQADDFGVVYILKTPRHQMPKFHILARYPNDTGNGYDVVSRIGSYQKVTPRTGRY